MLKLCLAEPWVCWAEEGLEKWEGPSEEKKWHMLTHRGETGQILEAGSGRTTNFKQAFSAAWQSHIHPLTPLLFCFPG